MAELFQQNLVPIRTIADIFGQLTETEALNTIGVNNLVQGQDIVNPNIIGGDIKGATYKSSESGARVEIRPNSDRNIGVVVYDADGNKVFETIIDGTDVGDVNIGDVSGGQGIEYDKSTGVLKAGGEEIATIISNSKIWYDEFVFLGNYGDGLTETPGAGGTITRGLVVTTMVSASSNLCSLISTTFGSGDGSNKNFECLITVKLLAITAQDAFWGVGDGYDPTNTAITDHHAAFIIEDGTLYASVADGTTQTLSSAITGITLTDYNKYKIIHTAGTDAKFYVNDVLKATLTTNLPSSTSSKIAMSIKGAPKTMYVINNYTLLKNLTDL